jgi:hypothetical protein
MYSDKYKTETFIYSKLGCSFLNLYENTKPECKSFFIEATNAVLKNARSGDLVLLSSLRLKRFSDQWTRFDDTEVIRTSLSTTAIEARNNAISEADKWINNFDKNNLKIVFLAPTPIFRAPAFRCSDWFNSKNPICLGKLTSNRDFQKSYREPVMFAINELKRSHRNVFIFDAFKRFAPWSF